MMFDFLLKRLRRLRSAHAPEDAPLHAMQEEEDEAADLLNPFPDPVIVEFRDVIDLHSIPPAQVRAVVEDFLAEAHARRWRFVRIVHGKGVGVQREMVRSILQRTPFVLEFSDAPPEAGGWGATVATLEVRSA
jgi:dsDNA-specific endonuclease/ATPase MutS2